MSDSQRIDTARVPPPGPDLLCPQLTCQTPLAWACDPLQLVCERCGWMTRLTAEHYADILDALTGITELNLPAYLVILSL